LASRFFRYDGPQTAAFWPNLLRGNDTAMFGLQASAAKGDSRAGAQQFD
jgi:hypothetical protein